YFDLYFSLDVDGARYHNHAAKHLTGTITSVPPNPGEVYRNFVPTPLLGDGESVSAYQARRMIFEPFDLKQDSTVVDTFPDARMVLDLRGPWGFDQVVTSGAIRMETDLGSLGDPDQDQLDQVPTHLSILHGAAAVSLLGHVTGPIDVQLGDSLVVGQ